MSYTHGHPSVHTRWCTYERCGFAVNGRGLLVFCWATECYSCHYQPPGQSLQEMLAKAMIACLLINRAYEVCGACVTAHVGVQGEFGLMAEPAEVPCSGLDNVRPFSAPSADPKSPAAVDNTHSLDESRSRHKSARPLRREDGRPHRKRPFSPEVSPLIRWDLLQHRTIDGSPIEFLH